VRGEGTQLRGLIEIPIAILGILGRSRELSLSPPAGRGADCRNSLSARRRADSEIPIATFEAARHDPVHREPLGPVAAVTGSVEDLDA